MYNMKTLLPEFNIEIPNCMYRMKELNNSIAATGGADGAGSKVDASNNYSSNHSQLNGDATTCPASPLATSATSTNRASSTCTSTIKKNNECALDLDKLGAQIQNLLKSSSDAEVITFRQEVVLKQLEDLKKQMAAIRASLGVCQKGIQNTTQTTCSNAEIRKEPLPDIVINGHPNFIPYALLALKNAWKDLFTIDVKTYTHSTVPDIGVEAREFEKKLLQVPVDATKPKINVTLIWKNCEHTEMICSPTMYVPIYGEVNIIRYLGRVGPFEYRYELSPLVNEIDIVLDICYQLLRCTTAKARATMLSALHERLGKQKYFGGDQMSVADIGVHSSLKRMPAITPKDLTPALSEWRKRVQDVTLL